MTTVRMRFANGLDVRVTLSEGTQTADALLDAIPFKSVAQRWGDEVYFDAPFHSERETDARAEMEVGDVAFWPDGDAVALFFGRTPISTDAKPRAYSPCNILGGVEDNPARLGGVREGTGVEVLKE